VTYDSWIGGTETRRDVIAEAPLRGLAALLDYETPPWGAVAPPLAHWLFFLPTARQSEIDLDGHPKRGGFLPPVDLPRRMWAGGRLVFHRAIPVGASVDRVSTIKSTTRKAGASGEMVFVTVAHELSVDGALAVSEEQDIVYRGAVGTAPPVEVDQRVSTHTRAYTADAVALFRFSALTFNAHRIHYDRDYAVNTEKYPGLVVQGPFIATLLMDHMRRKSDARVRSFSFRAQRPLFDGEAAELCANDAGEVWCRNAAGAAVMSARVETA
jgi:3-methylfumaryl-CoA hydratase